MKSERESKQAKRAKDILEKNENNKIRIHTQAH